MNKEKVLLKIDDREDEHIFKIIEKKEMQEFKSKLGIELEVKKERLLVGDYVVTEKNLCIERKSFTDFINSIRSRHLYEQLLNMENNYEHNYLIISGNIKDLAFNPNVSYTVNEFVGSIASLMVRFNVKIMIVNNDNQLIKLVFKIIEKSYSTKVVSCITKVKRTNEDIKVAMLCCIPKLGESKSRELLKKYKISDLPKLTKQELMNIDGIGNKLSESIINVFNS